MSLMNTCLRRTRRWTHLKTIRRMKVKAGKCNRNPRRRPLEDARFHQSVNLRSILSWLFLMSPVVTTMRLLRSDERERNRVPSQDPETILHLVAWVLTIGPRRNDEKRVHHTVMKWKSMPALEVDRNLEAKRRSKVPSSPTTRFPRRVRKIARSSATLAVNLVLILSEAKIPSSLGRRTRRKTTGSLIADDLWTSPVPPQAPRNRKTPIQSSPILPEDREEAPSPKYLLRALVAPCLRIPTQSVPKKSRLHLALRVVDLGSCQQVPRRPMDRRSANCPRLVLPKFLMPLGEAKKQDVERRRRLLFPRRLHRNP
mmetsp:Transcript_33855/g.82059  ORF Transcript_33855/g.82059 Transcript_33855/m.82059 type:complete len:313 (-) Transcript_33855:182-1120(-)